MITIGILFDLQAELDRAYVRLDEATTQHEIDAAVHDINSIELRMREIGANAKGECNIPRPLPWVAKRERELVKA